MEFLLPTCVFFYFTPYRLLFLAFPPGPLGSGDALRQKSFSPDRPLALVTAATGTCFFSLAALAILL